MRTNLSTRLWLAIFGSALTIAACSFVTDFPDVETLGTGASGADAPGGGNTGGSGATAGDGGGGNTGGDSTGGGGAVPCVSADCQNCISVAGSCPAAEEPELFTLFGVPATPGATTVFLNDIVVQSAGARFIGTFRDSGGIGMIANASSLHSLNQQAGFILDENGSAIAGAAACNDDGTNGGDETIFAGATVSDDQLVIAGLFEGGRMVLFDNTLDCAATGNGMIDGPGGNDVANFVPFLLWLDKDDLVSRSLEPTAEAGPENGYLADVAALGGGSVGQVAAIGIAHRDPFNAGADFENEFRYYVVSSSGPTPTALVPLPKTSCKDFNQLDGLRASVAVDSADQVWFAGTGCPFGPTGPDQSFLGRFSNGVDLSGMLTMSLGSSKDPIAITEVAVSDDMVVVAGTYAGSPIAALDGGGDIPTGDDADGFVMAFDRAAWGNQADPIWFQRIASDGGPAIIDALVIDGGRVFVSGSVADGGGIGSAQGCFGSKPLGKGRAFYAQLSELSGTLNWLRMDGFAVGGSLPPTNFFARGSALLPQKGGLLTATRSHGEVFLTCGPTSTDDQSRPEVHVRFFDFP